VIFPARRNNESSKSISVHSLIVSVPNISGKVVFTVVSTVRILPGRVLDSSALIQVGTGWYSTKTFLIGSLSQNGGCETVHLFVENIQYILIHKTVKKPVYHSSFSQRHIVTLVIDVLSVGVNPTKAVFHNIMQLNGEDILDIFLQPIEVHPGVGLFHYVNAGRTEHTLTT